MSNKPTFEEMEQFIVELDQQSKKERAERMQRWRDENPDAANSLARKGYRRHSKERIVKAQNKRKQELQDNGAARLERERRYYANYRKTMSEENKEKERARARKYSRLAYLRKKQLI